MAVAYQPAESNFAPGERGGCIRTLLMILAGSWLVGVIAVGQSVTWVWEQASFTSSLFAYDPRWIIGLVSSLAIWLPLFFLSRFGSRIHRPIFTTWRMMADVAVLMTPARLFSLTSSQEVCAWQIAVLFFYLVILRLTIIRKNPELQFHLGNLTANILWVASGIGVILLIPWVAWGALGSILDTLLGGIVSLLAGLAAALAFITGMFSPDTRSRPARRMIWRRLIGAPMAMAILAFALGLNMNEWLVLMAIPPLGWLAAELFLSAGNDQSTWLAAALVLAAGISGPLLWFDPDELAAVVTSGKGELIEWADTAGLGAIFVSCLAAALMRIILHILFKNSGTWNKRIPRLITSSAWIAASIIYLWIGRPGFYGEQLFVIFKSQADLSPITQQSDTALRRTEVYQALTKEANSDQLGLRQVLSRWGVRYQAYYLVNALEVDGGPLMRLFLMNRPEVDRILNSPHLRPLPAPLPVQQRNERAPASPDWNLSMVNANQVWDELGVTGTGIIIGQSDSGVDATHPELASQYRGRGGHDNLSWLDPWFQTRQPVDIGGHGTHTLGTALGKTVGVAPGAEWIGCANLARNLGNPALYLDCWQFMLAPYPPGADSFKEGRPEMGANVLNNSWGCPVVEGCDPAVFEPAVKALATAGIFVVASAGNEGENGCGSLTDPPAIYQDVFTVGAVNAQKQRVAFSSLGPVIVDGSLRVKPDLMAPGEQVLSAFPNGTYARISGTSMAGPHVAGTVALMWSANPHLIGDIQRTRQILVSTAQPYQGRMESCDAGDSPNDTAGYGIVNALAAVQMAIQEK